MFPTVCVCWFCWFFTFTVGCTGLPVPVPHARHLPHTPHHTTPRFARTPHSSRCCSYHAFTFTFGSSYHFPTTYVLPPFSSLLVLLVWLPLPHVWLLIIPRLPQFPFTFALHTFAFTCRSFCGLLLVIFSLLFIRIYVLVSCCCYFCCIYGWLLILYVTSLLRCIGCCFCCYVTLRLVGLVTLIYHYVASYGCTPRILPRLLRLVIGLRLRFSWLPRYHTFPRYWLLITFGCYLLLRTLPHYVVLTTPFVTILYVYCYVCVTFGYCRLRLPPAVRCCFVTFTVTLRLRSSFVCVVPAATVTFTPVRCVTLLRSLVDCSSQFVTVCCVYYHHAHVPFITVTLRSLPHTTFVPRLLLHFCGRTLPTLRLVTLRFYVSYVPVYVYVRVHLRSRYVLRLVTVYDFTRLVRFNIPPAYLPHYRLVPVWLPAFTLRWLVAFG